MILFGYLLVIPLSGFALSIHALISISAIAQAGTKKYKIISLMLT